MNPYFTYEPGDVAQHHELAAIRVLDVALLEATRALAAAHPDLRHYPRDLVMRYPIPPSFHRLWALLRTAASLRQAIAAYVAACSPEPDDPEFPF